MDALRVGDKILTDDGTFSEIFGFLDHDASAKDVVYIELKARNTTVRLSAGHIVFVASNAQPAEPIFARDARVGDELIVHGEQMPIVAIAEVRADGMHSPMTLRNTLVVNGVLASVYGDVDGVRKNGKLVVTGHSVGVIAHAPLRLLYRLYPGISSPSWHRPGHGRHLYTQMLADQFDEARVRAWDECWHFGCIDFGMLASRVGFLACFLLEQIVLNLKIVGVTTVCTICVATTTTAILPSKTAQTGSGE